MANEILLRKFPNVKLTELTGGYTNKTILLDGSHPLMVAKIFYKNNKDARNEISILHLLNSSDVSPGIHDYFEDDTSLYIIMDYIQGGNGQRFLDSNDMDAAREIYRLLGILLSSEIHSIRWKDQTSELPIIELEDDRLDSLDFVPSDLKNEVKRILNVHVMHDVKTIIHGDYGPYNTILTEDSLVVIDWEWGGWGHPLQDIAWVVWFVHLHYPDVADELSGIFLKAYREHSAVIVTEELIKAFALSRVINILHRIKNADMSVQKEWLKRLEWTLKTTFLGDVTREICGKD
ncbi:phosphotransferase family protein [Paenibacillus tundrae]|uniref:Aminoglycoside phosphotransferase (APT) family kinase protein n=1 Tax=Paenibacillus tundrae TaxID=528187 RepID=A0ABT9WA10_9BACL|nr:aminoglycoside phosphotransferase family protein [Paenibacillus tundrae]MDQ0170094.1 aminoglycoside phosphotransferase (APT) family kinase protein [Paenibacillus tundrae]